MPAGEFRLLFCVHVNAAAKNCTALLEGRNKSAYFFPAARGVLKDALIHIFL